MGWATAWSFDRLRIWMETGAPPESTFRITAGNVVARWTVALVWLWHGVVPKLLFHDPDEVLVLTNAGLAGGLSAGIVTAAGWLEILFGLCTLIFWRSRWPMFSTIALMIAATAGVIAFSPLLLKKAFNPITLNLLMISAASVVLLTHPYVATARRCADPGIKTDAVKSIYQIALGDEFDRLHPSIRERFGFSSVDRVASIGRGVMERIWHGRFYTLPFLYVGTWRRIMFPESAHNVPFQIENYAYVDRYGRETVTWLRTFETRRRRRFDAYMIYSTQRRRIVDYLGTHQHLAVDIDLKAGENGGLCLRSGEQRFYEGALAFRFPRLFSGVADVCEWFDDNSGRFRIEVKVTNKVWGPLFGYRGWFDVERVTINESPASAKPVREERRE